MMRAPLRAFSVLAIVAASVTISGIADTLPHPFAILMPAVRINPADETRLDAGKPMVKVLPGVNRELMVVAATRTSAPPERLITWGREVARLHQSKYVPRITRFSDPPRLDDLDTLALDNADLNDLRSCRPGNCGIKLSAGEIARLQQHATGQSDWKNDVQQEFRRTVLERVKTYIADGDFGLPPYHDAPVPIAPDVESASLLDRLGLMSPYLPGVAEYLQLYPRVDHPFVVDSFLYWSTEALGFKPTTSVTHVTMLSSDAPYFMGTLVVSKQVFATHYRDGALSLMAIVGPARERYLVYTHGSHVDVLEGPFGRLVRTVVERRVREEAPAALTALRKRLEGGNPRDIPHVAEKSPPAASTRRGPATHGS